MSTTGNLLFPEDEDEGWVTSIIKALPEKEPEKKPPAPGSPDPDAIEDPVAVEAEAAFAEAEAKAAVSEAIDAAGWSATAVKAAPETPPEFGTAEEEWRAAEALDALDAAITRAAGDPAFTDIDDPVSDAANAAFAETDADTAARDAIDAAGWTATVVEPGTEPAIGDVLDAAGWTAAVVEPGTEPVESGLSPEALAALDSVIARDGAEDGLLAPAIDPVAIEAEASFAETAAEIAAEDAVFAAGWSAMASKSGDIGGVGKLSAAELKALNMAMAKDARGPGALAEIDDPVRLAGDARFTEVAADVATRDAIRMAAPVARDVLESLDPLSISEQRALDAAITEQTISRMDPGAHGDPVALAADSVFTDIAAELAIADALMAASRSPPPAPAVIAGAPGQPITGPGLWEVEDLVRAEAEIAFEDAAYDLAYSTVDSLVTGEAAALAAFDQAIASGADPEEALALAIAAAEEIDPRSFGMTLLAAQRVTPDDVRFQAPGPDEEGPGPASPADESAPPDQPQDAPEDLIVFARVGDNFETLPAEEQALGGPGADTLGGLAPGFEFFLDLEFVSGAGSHFRAVERDDEPRTGADAGDGILAGTAGADTLTGTSGADNIFGYAGDDVLAGGRGDDTLTGGAGADEFVFEGGSGADALTRAASLGTDRITDYSAADGDTFGLADADFGFGAAGTLTDGADYFEFAPATLSAAPLDASGGIANAGIVVFGDGAGTDGVDVYYTDDASAMTTSNSYQIADVDGINTGDIAAGDFNLKA